MAKKLFLTIPNSTCCKCGEFYITPVIVEGRALLACSKEDCQYQVDLVHYGLCEIGGKTYDVYLRKVRKEE